MNKKPAARFISGMCGNSIRHHLMVHNPYGIGQGLHEELMLPVAIEFGSYTGQTFEQDHKVLDALHDQLVSRMLRKQVSDVVDQSLRPDTPVVAASVKHDWDSNTMNMGLSIQHWMDVVRQTKVEEVSCRVPEELRERFKAEGFTDDELDRMVLYPERCSLTPPDLEIVYKLDPKQDGVS